MMSTKTNDLKQVNKNTELSRKPPTPAETLINSIKAPINHKEELRKAKQNEALSCYQERCELSDKEWAKVREAAQRLLQSGQEGYDNYMSAMSKILQTAEQRNKWLLSHNNIGDFLYHSIPGVLAMPLVMVGLLERTENFLGVLGTFLIGSDRLPALNYSVGFNDDNTLVIYNLTRDNHTSFNPRGAIRNLVRGNMESDLTKDEMLAFQALVVAFLSTKGYEPNPAHPGKFNNTTNGLELTKGEFNRLVDEYAADLRAYLRDALKGDPSRGIKGIEVNELPPSPGMGR